MGHKMYKDGICNSWKKLVLIDESGDMGFSKGSSKDFIMAATVTDLLEQFRSIVDRYPYNTRDVRAKSVGELKYNTSSDDIRCAVLEDIMELKPTIFIIVVRKQDLPSDWKSLDGKGLYRKTMEELINDIMTNMKGPLSIIHDEHTSVSRNFLSNLAKEKGESNNCEIIDATIRRSNKEKALQTHDFVAGSSRDKFSYRKRAPFDVIESSATMREIKKG